MGMGLDMGGMQMEGMDGASGRAMEGMDMKGMKIDTGDGR
jgi:hypothetical protein